MTVEVAIKELNADKALYETDNCHAGDGTPDGDLMLALDMAIEALEKQIPKKTLEGNYYFEYRCPCCGFVFNGAMPFCLSCGQAIDWSDIDERV